MNNNNLCVLLDTITYDKTVRCGIRIIANGYHALYDGIFNIINIKS